MNGGADGSGGERARSARALLVVAAAVAFGLLLGLLWLLRSEAPEGRAATADAAGTPLPADGAADETALASVSDARDAAGMVLAPGELWIPVGVRLAGDGRLEGRVRERASGAGVAGVRLDLQVVPPAGLEQVQRITELARFHESTYARFRAVATAASDADGNFVFRGVRAGRYYLETRGAWHVPDSLPQVLVAASGAGGPLDVWVRAGGRVIGRVLDPDGRPVGGASVFCSPGPGTILERLRQGDVRGLETKSDGEGRFLFHGVPPGPGFELSASASGWSVGHRTGVTIAPGEDTLADVSLRRGASLSGRVLAAAADGAAEPLAGAYVGALPRGLRDLHYAREVLDESSTRTAADGSYRLTHVPPGDVDVIAWAEGYLHGVGPGVQVDDGHDVHVPDVVLRSGPRLELSVQDGAGAPIAGAQASWWVADWEAFRYRIGFTPFLLQAVPGFRFPQSDAEGRVRAGPFPGEPPYRVAVFRPGFAMMSVEWSPGEEPSKTVTLHRGGAIEGVVLGLDTGLPLTRFTLLAPDRMEQNPEAPTGWDALSGSTLCESPDGTFRIENLPVGPAEFGVHADGYLSAAVQADVTEGETTRGVVVTLLAGGTLRGRVLDGTGAPVAGAEVLAVDDRGRALQSAPRGPRMRANDRFARQNQDFALDFLEAMHSLGSPGPGSVLSAEDGSFELRALPDGTHRLRAWHRDFARTESEPIQVRPGPPIEGIELVLGAGGAIEGRVSDLHGRPVPGAIVVAARPDELQRRISGELPAYAGESGADGRYAIEHLPAASYFLFVTRGDAALDPLSFLGTLNFDLVRVPESTRVRYDLIDSSASGVRVYGRVTSAGLPVAEGTLFALSFEGENLLGVDMKIAEVESDGSYEFPGLRPGDYQFRYGGEQSEIVLDVEVPDEAEVRLDLALPEGAVSGRVIDAATGQPLAGAEVLAVRAEGAGHGAEGLIGQLMAAEGRRVRERTGEDGAYRLARLQAGDWKLFVNPPRGGAFAASEGRTLTIEEGRERAEVDFALEPALVLSGRVRGEDGRPLRGVRVVAYPKTASLADAPSDLSDADGRFELVGLAKGGWRLGASKRGYADAPLVELEIADGAPPEQELVLSEGFEVRVRVLDVDGAPAPGATGRLVRLDGETAPNDVAVRRVLDDVIDGQGLSGADGVLDLGRHVAGRYRVEVVRAGRRGVLDEVEVSAGVGGPFEVRLQ